MRLDNEGYSCAERLHGGTYAWWIIDRYSTVIESEPPRGEYGEARQRADEMNDDVIARRLADMIAKRKPRGEP